MIKKFSCRKNNRFSINLIDEHNHLLGVDDEQNCCEIFETYIVFINNNGDTCVLSDIDTIFDARFGNNFPADKFSFTGRFYDNCEEIPDSKVKEEVLREVDFRYHDIGSCDSLIFVEVINNETKDVGYIVANNNHNGYYSHEIELSKDDKILMYECL